MWRMVFTGLMATPTTMPGIQVQQVQQNLPHYAVIKKNKK